LNNLPEDSSSSKEIKEETKENSTIESVLQSNQTVIVSNETKDEFDENGEYNPSRAKTTKNVQYTSCKKVLNEMDFPTYTENLRVEFTKSIKAGKWLNTSLNIGLLVFAIMTVVFAFIGMNKNPVPTWNTVMIWVSLALALCFLIASLIVSSSYKKRNNGLGFKYERNFTDAYLDYMYLDRPGISGMQYCIEANVKDDDVIRTHYWATINYISSRLRVVSLYKDLEFTDTEILMSCPYYSTFVRDIEEYFAAIEPKEPLNIEDIEKEKEEEKIEEEKASAPISKENPDPGHTEKKSSDSRNPNARTPELGAYGHFYTYKLIADPNEALIVVRTIEDTYLPTNVKGFQRLSEYNQILGDDFIVYASSKETAQRYLNEKVVSSLKEMKSNCSIYDFFLSFNRRGCYFMMNTTEELINVPTDKKANYSYFEELNNNTTQMLNIFDALREIREK